MANPSQISLFGFEEEAPAPQAAEPAASVPVASATPAAPAASTAPAAPEQPEEVAVPEPEATFVLNEEPPIVVVLRDETTVAFEGPKKRGRKKREKKWTTDTPGKRGRKSLSEAAAIADLVEIPVDEILYQKQYYSMGEVCDMFRMNPSHVRIWSREFEAHLQLKKNKKGDRFFRPDDVKTLHFIHHLIRERKYTINGAREFLKQQQKGAKAFDLLQSLEKIKSFLLELKAGL